MCVETAWAENVRLDLTVRRKVVHPLEKRWHKDSDGIRTKDLVIRKPELYHSSIFAVRIEAAEDTYQARMNCCCVYADEYT